MDARTNFVSFLKKWCLLQVTAFLRNEDEETSACNIRKSCCRGTSMCAPFQVHRRLQHICILLMFDLKQDQSKRKVSLQVSAQHRAERSRVLGDGEDDEGAAGPA